MNKVRLRPNMGGVMAGKVRMKDRSKQALNEACMILADERMSLTSVARKINIARPDIGVSPQEMSALMRRGLEAGVTKRDLKGWTVAKGWEAAIDAIRTIGDHSEARVPIGRTLESMAARIDSLESSIILLAAQIRDLVAKISADYSP